VFGYTVFTLLYFVFFLIGLHTVVMFITKFVINYMTVLKQVIAEKKQAEIERKQAMRRARQNRDQEVGRMVRAMLVMMLADSAYFNKLPDHDARLFEVLKKVDDLHQKEAPNVILSSYRNAFNNYVNKQVKARRGKGVFIRVPDDISVNEALGD
jgi:uncharacterized protein YcbK (DUF882 family)